MNTVHQAVGRGGWLMGLVNRIIFDANVRQWGGVLGLLHVDFVARRKFRGYNNVLVVTYA